MSMLTMDINPTIILPRRKGIHVQNVYINGILQQCKYSHIVITNV